MAAQNKTVTVNLDDPIEVDGTTFDSLTFRRMKTKDLVAMDNAKGDTNKSLHMYASMADVPVHVLYELGPDDFQKVTEETLPLMGKSVRNAAEKARADNQEEVETTS